MIGSVLVAGTAVAKMAVDMKKSDELKEEAKRKRKKAYRTISEAEYEKMCEEEKMNRTISRLITRKKAILITSIQQFIDVYSMIKKIKFRESDGIKELDNYSPACCQELHNQVVIIQQKDFTPSGITKDVVIGFLIAGIGGAATASIVNDANNELNMAKDKFRQAQVIAEQQKIYSLSYKAITERADRMTNIMTELNQCFVKSLHNTEKMIEEKGTNRDEYTTTDISQIGVCLNLAKALKDILDVTILDANGKVSQASLQAIEMGNQCLIDMSESLSAI